MKGGGGRRGMEGLERGVGVGTGGQHTPNMGKFIKLIRSSIEFHWNPTISQILKSRKIENPKNQIFQNV